MTCEKDRIISNYLGTVWSARKDCIRRHGLRMYRTENLQERSYSNKLHSTVTVWSATKDRILTNILPYVQDNLRERSFLPNSHRWKRQTSLCLLQSETKTGSWLNFVGKLYQ
jgi:hypothetical protein